MFLGDMVWYLIHVGHGSPMSHSLWFYPSYSALPWLQKGPILHFIKWWHFQRHNLVCLICSSKRIRDLARKKLYGDKCVGCQFSCSSTQIMIWQGSIWRGSYWGALTHKTGDTEQHVPASTSCQCWAGPATIKYEEMGGLQVKAETENISQRKSVKGFTPFENWVPKHHRSTSVGHKT